MPRIISPPRRLTYCPYNSRLIDRQSHIVLSHTPGPLLGTPPTHTFVVCQNNERARKNPRPEVAFTAGIIPTVTPGRTRLTWSGLARAGPGRDSDSTRGSLPFTALSRGRRRWVAPRRSDSDSHTRNACTVVGLHPAADLDAAARPQTRICRRRARMQTADCAQYRGGLWRIQLMRQVYFGALVGSTAPIMGGLV